MSLYSCGRPSAKVASARWPSVTLSLINNCKEKGFNSLLRRSLGPKDHPSILFGFFGVKREHIKLLAHKGFAFAALSYLNHSLDLQMYMSLWLCTYIGIYV